MAFKDNDKPTPSISDSDHHKQGIYPSPSPRDIKYQSRRLSSACVRLSTKQPPEYPFGGSIILTGFLLLPRAPFTPAAFVIDGKGRRGRDAGNNGFRMVIGRTVCREGDIVDARGDETRGRFVLIASDMIWVLLSESRRVYGRVNDGRGSAMCVGRVFGGEMLALRLEKEGMNLGSKRARPFIKECLPVAVASPLCWGPRNGQSRSVGVLDRKHRPAPVLRHERAKNINIDSPNI